MNLDPILLAELQRGGPPLWVSGRTYPVGFVVRSPGNLENYVRVTAGAGNADPSEGDANWMILSKRVEVAVTAVRDSLSAARTEAGMWRDDVKAAVVNARDQVNGHVYRCRDEVQGTVNAARDAVWAQVVACHATVGDVKDIVNWLRTLAEGSGIKSVQRGMFLGDYGKTSYAGTYDIPISHVDPQRSTLTLLTVDMASYQISNKSIMLTPDGNAVRSYAGSYGQSTYFPPFSWEVIEWRR